MLSHEQIQIAWMFFVVTIWAVMILYKDQFVILKSIVFAIITVVALVSLVGGMMVIGPIGTIGGLIYMTIPISDGGD